MKNRSIKSKINYEQWKVIIVYCYRLTELYRSTQVRQNFFNLKEYINKQKQIIIVCKHITI